jgi:predicted transposase YbfD/YdcC
MAPSSQAHVYRERRLFSTRSGQDIAASAHFCDAIFTQREICLHIRDRNGHYLFTVKDNQPELKRNIAEAFGDLSPCGPPPDRRQVETTGKEHGRIEVRRIAVASEVVPHLAWPGAAQAVRIERHRYVKGRESVEVAYLITSLTTEEAGHERLLELNRAHWAIENRLHHVRDVTFNEDRCRVRKGARPLATLRNTAISLIRKCGLAIPEARENFREDRAEAIRTVTGKIL